MIEKVGKNSLILFFTKIIAPLSTFIIIYYVALKLKAEGMGEFNIIFTYLTLFQIFSELGLNTYLSKQIPISPEKKDLYFLSSVTVAFSASLFLILIIDLIIFSLPYSDVVRKSIYISSFVLIAHSINVSFEGIYNGLNRIEIYGAGILLENVFKLFFSIYGLLRGKGIVYLSIIYLFSKILASILFISFYYFKVSSKKLSLDLKFLKELIKEIFAFSGILFIYSFFWRIDIITLSILRNPADTGIYSMASKLILVWGIIPMSISQALVPILSGLKSKEYQNFKRYFSFFLNLTTWISILPFLLSFFYPEKIIRFLRLPEEFIHSSFPLKILSFMIILWYMNEIFQKTLICLDFQKKVFWIGVRSTVVGLGSIFLLTHLYGYNGTAAGLILTYLFDFSQSLFYLLRMKVFDSNNLKIFGKFAILLILNAFYLTVLKDFDLIKLAIFQGIFFLASSLLLRLTPVNLKKFMS
ncbi:MAG: flippase [Acidobacteriota bacterium]